MSMNARKYWLETRLPAAAAWRSHFTTPLLARGQPYLNTLPALILGTLVFMAVSGFVLGLFYNPYRPVASLQFINRDVNYGWLIHGFHQTGTTMIFGLVFLWLLRAMFGGGYRAPGELVWVLSIAQLALLLLVGYLGTLLTNGAVSYWSLAGATAGADGLGGLPGGLGSWFFGGPDGAGTLARLAVFHVALALVIFGILALYGMAKRAVAPLPVPSQRLVSFHPYYTTQYFAAFVIFALIFAVILFFAPHLGDNPLNQSPASQLLMPTALTPPWYLLSLAGGSHALPGTWGGIIMVLAMLAVLFALPWLDRSRQIRPGGLYRLLILLLVLDVVLLSLATAAAPSTLASICMVLFTAYYFLHFIVLVPLVTTMENR